MGNHPAKDLWDWYVKRVEAQQRTERARAARVREDLKQRLLERHGEFWTVKEAAKYLGVDEKRIREEIRGGRLPHHTPGGGVRGARIYYLDLCDYIMKARKSGGG